MSSNYIDIYWKHKKTILKSLEYCVGYISSVIPSQEVKRNIYLQEDLTNSILSIYNIIEQIDYPYTDYNWNNLSKIVKQNQDILAHVMQRYISDLEKSIQFVTENISIPLSLENTNKEINTAKEARDELFPSSKREYK